MRPGPRSGIGTLVGAAYAAALLAFGLLAGISGATTLSVSTEAEYRAALATLSGDNSGPHTINVTADITIDDGTDPTYTGSQPLTIEGNGHTLDATNSSRVLNQLPSTAGLTLNDLTVANGMADLGGGIFTFGSVTATNSIVTGNTASADAGGIFASGAVTLTNSTVSENTADSGPGGGIVAGGEVTLTNSTVSGNTSAGNGGGMFVDDSVTLTNSTVSGNTAGGASIGGGIFANESVALTYATVVDNSASAGANLRGSALTAFGSVVALPQGGGANCQVAGGTTSQGYNYSDDDSCGFMGTGDTEDGANPQLGPLTANGGPTQTRLPQPSSPLIDPIPVADCHDTVTDDQRGVVRPQDGDDDGALACDIGAVEVEVTPPDDGGGDGDGEAGPADAVGGQPSFTG